MQLTSFVLNIDIVEIVDADCLRQNSNNILIKILLTDGFLAASVVCESFFVTQQRSYLRVAMTKLQSLN